MSALPNIPQLLCAPSPAVTYVESFFDQPSGTIPADGIVNGAHGTGLAGSYPYYAFFQQDASTSLPHPIRVLRNSSSYGRNITDVRVGNLVVVGYICGDGMPQFVSAHFRLYYENDQVSAELVRLDAGDRLAFVPERSESGVVMSSWFSDEWRLETRTLTTSQPRADGSVSARVTFVDPGAQRTWSANVFFEFDAPIATR